MPDVPNISSARPGSRLRELGLVLPKAPTPLGAYVGSNLAQGRTDLIALWARQAAPLCRYHKAAELFAALVQETDGILKGRSV